MCIMFFVNYKAAYRRPAAAGRYFKEVRKQCLEHTSPRSFRDRKNTASEKE